jgi:hypothetical protein
VKSQKLKVKKCILNLLSFTIVYSPFTILYFTIHYSLFAIHLKRFLFVFIIILFATVTNGQQLSGIWRGTLTQAPGGCYPIYHLEIQIGGNAESFTGTTYDYYDKSKFVKLKFSGRYNAATKRLMIIEGEVEKFNIPKDCVPCIKTYALEYSKQGNKELLSGTWKGNEMESKKNCPPGKIELERVSSSDFAVDIIQEPALQKIQTTLQLQPREKEIIKSIVLQTSEISIDLYDNADVDNDTITVLLNNKLLLYKQRLTGKAHNIKFTAYAGMEYELMMYADNLGLIPPNTALMVVRDGTKKYEIRLTSTDKKTAVVKFIH